MRLLEIENCSVCYHCCQLPKEIDNGIYRCSYRGWKELPDIIGIPKWCPLAKVPKSTKK